MSERTVLTEELNDAYGSAFDPGTQRLFITEAGGILSCVHLIQEEEDIVMRGEVVLQGTYQFDFDGGSQSPEGKGFDVWWEQQTETERRMTPINGAQIAPLGETDIDTLSSADLQGLNYSDTPVSGSVDETNLLQAGYAFAVRTTSGNYTKVQVVEYGYDIGLRYTTYALKDRYEVLAEDYAGLTDVELSTNSDIAYLVDAKAEQLLRVNLNESASREAAEVLVEGLNVPMQLALDEDRGCAYVVESSGKGRLVCVTLSTGKTQTVVDGLEGAIGLVVTSDGTTGYVTLSKGVLLEVDLMERTLTVLSEELAGAGMLTFGSPNERTLLVPLRGENPRVVSVDLTLQGENIHTVTEDIGEGVISLHVKDDNCILVVGGFLAWLICLLRRIFGLGEPFITFIGRIPRDRIDSDGYASTSPPALINVTNAPFGATLPVKMNFDRARLIGAKYYTFEVDGNEPRQTWRDYRWNGFFYVLRDVSPSASGYYRVRGANERWRDPDLGYKLNTRYLTTGLHTITVRFYTSENRSTEIADESLDIRIDNEPPTVDIERILHDGANVPACGIVESGPNEFAFTITAEDREGHLKAWNLVAFYGNNQSQHVDDDSYSATRRLWNGPNSQTVPASRDWGATNTRCAHTFRLTAFSRSTNGLDDDLHEPVTRKSITILLS